VEVIILNGETRQGWIPMTAEGKDGNWVTRSGWDRREVKVRALWQFWILIHFFNIF